MPREKLKRRKPQGESTDAGDWGGWLTARMEKNGEVIERSRGTPQGGVVSPILSNLFLHYAFDLWMTRTHPDLPWCRYADDGLVHCQSEQQAEALKVELSSRLAACGLQMHPTKTKIVYRRTASTPSQRAAMTSRSAASGRKRTRTASRTTPSRSASFATTPISAGSRPGRCLPAGDHRMGTPRLNRSQRPASSRAPTFERPENPAKRWMFSIFPARVARNWRFADDESWPE